MDKQEILERLATAVVNGDRDLAAHSAKEAIGESIDPIEALEEGLSKGMDEVGDRFGNGEAYLPELLMAAEAYNSAMEVLTPEIEARGKKTARRGKIIIGTVKGDVHTIGKVIVATILSTNGYEVVDIGVDNSTLKFIQEAERVGADVIALSSLMTTTMPAQREVIDTLKELNLRDKYKVIIGGGPVSQEWAEEIGADGYGKTAIEAVAVVTELLSSKG
jgi:trimethylamine corrinoid protein